MPFTFNGGRLSEEQRKVMWSDGFPNWCANGFYIYFGPRQKDNMLSMSRNDEWWDGTHEYVPSHFVRQWLDSNYPGFAEDMKNLAEIMILKKDDYFFCADYLTSLYHEQGFLIRSLVAAEYMPAYLSEKFPTASQLFAEKVGLLMMEPSWPMNLSQELLDLEFDRDVEDFWKILAESIDEFLGLAVRSYRSDVNPDDDSPGNSGGPDDNRSGVPVGEFC